MRRSRVPPLDHLVGIGELLGQLRFPKPLTMQLRVGLTTTGDPRRYCKGGIDLEYPRRSLVRLSVTSEMGKGRREIEVGWQKEGVLTLGFLRGGDGLVKATKLDIRRRHPKKR